jgi:hypothetical protein
VEEGVRVAVGALLFVGVAAEFDGGAEVEGVAVVCDVAVSKRRARASARRRGESEILTMPGEGVCALGECVVNERMGLVDAEERSGGKGDKTFKQP